MDYLDQFFRRRDRDGFDTTPVVYIHGYDEPKKSDSGDSNNKGFLDEAENTTLWGLKHLWNGVKAIPRNLGEFVTMLAQQRVQGMNDPEMREVAKYAPDASDTLQGSVRQAREDLMNNEYLKPTKVEDNTLLAKFGGALLENGPQYLLMAPLGPYAGSIAMGGLAAGSTYESARQEQHMTDDQAIKAGLTDAPFEMALEHLGMKGTVLKSLGKGIGRATKSTRFADLGAKLNARLGKAGGWLEPGDPLQNRNVLRAAVEGFASEAPTEFAQQYAQQLSTDVYDPKVSKEQMLYNVTTNPKTFNEALFAGAVGGVMGGGMGAVLTPLHNRAIDKITAKTGTSYNSSVDNVLAQSKAGQEQAKIYDDVMAKREAQKKLEQRAEIQKAEKAEQEQRAQVAQQTQNAMPLGYEEFSDEIKQAINDNATKDVPPALIAAIIQQESGGNKTVVSPAGAQGLMQLMPGTASDNGVTDPFDVNDNVRGGVTYYTKLKKMFGGNDVVALAAYNKGEGDVQEWIKNGTWDGTLEHVDQIPVQETREYVKNVMSNWQGSISNGVYVNAGATPAEQMALIQSQNERDAAIREAYNQVANSQMAKDFALDLARTSTDPKVVNEVNRAVKLKDDKKLEEIARANGYVDEDLTPMPKKDTGNVFTTHNQAGAAQGNINTNDRVNISSMEENGGRPPIIAVDRKSMSAPTEMTVNDEANIVSDRIARALVGDTKNGNIAPISKQNVNNDTFIIKNGNGANSAVDTNISATVNTQPTGATVSGIQDVTNTLNSGDLPTAEQSAVAINELQDAPQSQERDDLIYALAKNINGESVAAPSQERTNQAVRTVTEPTVEPTATKEEALFTPTAQPRADAQDRLNEAVQKLQRRELPTKEEAQAILADLAHLPDSDGVRQSRAIFEGIVRRDFSMFGKNNQAQMEALAAQEDAERRAAQENASSKTGISLVDGAVSSNKALSNEESRGDVKTAVNKENVNRRINELLNTLKTGTIPTNEEMESVLRDVDTLTNTIPGYGNGIEAKMARVVFPRVMKGDFNIYRGATRKKLQESAGAKQAEIEGQNTGSNNKNPFAAGIYDNFNQSQHPNVHQDNSLVGIQKKTHALVTDINERGLYGKDVKENAKNKSLSKSVRIGLASNRLTVMGVFKPNDNGGDFVFQFKHSSKKVGEIKFSLRDFCEYAEAGGNAHVPIRRNMETVFYNSDFFKTHFETPGKNTDKSYVRYKDNNHENPPRADFFVDGMGSVFKDLITVYDNKYYKGETVVEGTKVEANKNNKATKDFADDHLIVGAVTDKGIVEDKQLKNKIVNTMKDEPTDSGEEKNTTGQAKQGDSKANTKAESQAQGQTKTEDKNDGALNKGVDKEESKENNEDKETFDNQVKKGADENDTGRPERSSGSRGRQGEERTAGTQEKGKDDTGAGRGVDSKHVGDVEQASVLRSGENQNDNEVRQSHSDDMERGEGTGEDKVQSHRSGSEVRLRERRSDDSQSTRNAVKGRDDTTGTDSGHENGSTESVGRTSGNERGTGKKQTGESSESVDKEETEITKEKNNERPKPEAIRRGRFYSNKTERENVTALLSKPSERVNANKEALNVYLRVTNDGAITDMGSISLKPKDLKALSMFTGWGGLKTQLQDMKIGDDSWLKEHFSDEEITTMMNSTTTGYFTPPAVIDFMWKAVVKMNVQQDARILEPSMGIGNFIMQLPKEYKDAAHITGIELDKITGNMSQLLYGADGKTNIRVQGYEQNRIGDNSFDLVIGNVPFSSNSFKTGEKRFDVYKPLLHDFFFLKAVKQTRPGGLIAFITTSGTMDKVDSKIRKAVAQEATLIAAYRLPNNTFAGTGVVADIIFLQKNNGEKNTNGVDADEWMRSEKVEEVNGSGVDSYMNTYFMKHPENILGKLDSTYDWRSGKNKITVSPKEGVSLEAELSKGIRKLPKDIVAQRTEAISGDTAITTITSDIKIGKIFVGKDGKFYRSVGNEEAEIIEDELKDIPAKVQRQMKGLIRLADDYRQLLEAEAEGKDTKKLREAVNKGYEIARKGNKAIRKSKAYEALIKAGDGSISILSSIETADGTASEILKHPLIRKDKVTKNPTIGEAVLMSAVGGNVDINKVADLAHTTTDKVKAAFIKEGIAYVTPNGNWQTKEKYINGNIAEKLTDAETAFSYGNKDMERNIRDLKAVLPERLSMNMVNVGFGVTWITPEIYEDFLISELYGEDIDDWRLSKIRESGAIQVSMAGDVCNININKNELIYGSNADSKTWNVIAGGKCKNIGINDIINAALSNKELVVYDQVKKGNIEYKELNQGKTDAANAMVQKLLDDWQTYIRTGKHKDELADSYNYIFNSFYTPTFDGSHLSFPGLAKEKDGKPFDLRTHQKDATYMGLIQGRCLFAHEVGTGKTYVMGALAMESKRLGLAHKTLILAKTANYISVANDIREEYPGAKVLVIDEKGDNAGGQIAEAMVGDWDIIVAPHSQMNLFLLSDEGYAKIEQEIRGEIREEMERVSGAAEIPGAIWRLIDGELKVTDEEVQTAIKKVKKSLKENSLEIKNILDSLKQRIRLLEKYGEAVKAAKHIPFEKLGIDQILVDEAHEFKKPGLFTRNQIKGLEINTSDMALKLRILTDNIIDRYGRNVHLFTGTPITNTAVELYQMMRYLMKPEMEAAHICSFDSWFAQYGKAESSLVKKTTGDYEEEIRFVGFKNLPDLRRLYGMNFDFVKTKDMPEFTERKVDGHTLTDPNLTEKEKLELENGRTEGADDVPYHKIVHERIDLSDDVKNFANRIAEASKEYANASGKEKQKLDKIGFEGSPLVAMRLLNQVALDPRLVGLPDYAGSKIQKCADNIMNEYESNKKVSQVVFMDTGVSDTRSINARDNSGESIRDENGKIVKEKVTGWNTAQALKDELVNRGIPEDEIVILSSDDKILKALKQKYKEKYNLPKQPETDELKKLIADEVNNCEVRIVIGTRSMLGTGINMQHNLKAMHQLDAPWMPGELEQSQGRGIRQGNQWNTVKEYRYITDLDAIKWARLAIKQSFITAIKDQKGTNREIEMDESMGSDIGGAEGDIYLTLSFAAQDNRLQEQKRLDKKVHKLENARKAFYRGQEVKEREATKEKAELPQLKSVQEGLTRLVNMKTDEDLAIRGIKKGEKQTDALARLENEMREKGYPKVVLGTYNGLTISGQRTTGYDTNLYVGDGKDDVLVKTISGGLNGRTLISTVTTALPQKIKAITGQIEKSKRDISEWEKTKDDTFPNEEALQKAIKRRNAIREDLKMNPEKPPAWLREKVPINSTVLVHGKPTIIRSYWTPKNAEGQKVHYLIDDAGDAYHISEITDGKTGRNPYEDDLANEPTDIKPENKNAVETNADGDTKSAADTETQETNTEDNTKYSVAEDEETDGARERETRHQGITIQSETKAYTLSDVKTSFKGQDVKQVGKNGFEVTLKNGNKVTITQTGEITRSDGKKIRGKYIKGNITLTNLANAFTLDHEIFHFAKDCLYTQKEWAFIEKKVRALLAREGNKNPTADEIEDRAADWYADWKYKRAHPSGVMQKLFHMVYDFVSRVTDLVHKNVNTRFSNLANGDLFERQMTDNHGNTMKYSTVEETNDAVEKTTKDIAEDTEHGFNMFTKAVSALKNFNKKDGRYNNITVEMNTNSFNWIKYGVMNPDHLAKNNETLKVFTDLGKNSMRELQHLRNDTEEKLNKIAKAIEGKDKNGNVRRELYDRIMEEGELNGEEYTREELVAEGIDKGVIDAYLETRKMYNDFYKMVDATKRGVETFHKTVNINGVEALRADTFVENLDVKPLANGRYEVTFGLAKKYPHLGEKVAGSDLKELLSSNYAKVNDIRDKDGVAVKIESTDDIKDEETYSVDYVTVPKPLSNIKGYFHHFFENWMVYEKVTDESDAVSYVPVGSYRSRREALQAFKKLDDLLHEDKKYTREELEAKGIDRNVIDTYMSTMMDNPAIGAHEYVIRPKEFQMPMNGGVALGDVKFEQAMRAIEAKYEVNEDEARKLAKGILKQKVGHRFLGATLHRTGQKGYSTDMLHVLHMYTTKATRYIALESFKNKAYRAFERFFGVPVDESKKGGLQQYIKKYIEDVNGNPTRIEEMFNELINNLTGGKLAKWFGTDRPFMSWSNTVMAYSAALKLGLFNISSAAINLTQLTNAVTLLGIKPFLKAHWIAGRFTDEERKFLKDVGVETQLGLDAGAGYDKNRMTSIQNKLINYSLFTFTWSEQKVRQITALMAFAEAKRRGMSYEEAVEFAQSANDDANFDYGVNNAPLFIRAGGPVTQMMFQFMKFPVNQIAFMTDIIRHGTNGQRARLMIPLVCAGTYGVPFWAAVICPALAAAVAGAAGDDYDDPELYLKKKCYEWAGDDPFWHGFLDVAFYGLPAKFGVNIGRRMGVGDFGGDVSKSLRGGKYGYDLGDLSLSLLGGVMFSSIKQAMTQWGNGNVIEAIKAFSPALGNAAQAVVGERRTTRGRVATRYDDISTRIIKALGFMPIEETKEGEQERILKDERRIKTRNEQRIIDDFIRAKEDGDKKRMHDLIETMRKKGIKPKRVADEIKRKNQTGLERAEDLGKKKQNKKPNTRKRYDGRLKHYSPKRSKEKGNSYDSLYNM